MWWLFTRKVRRHEAIQADETVYQACYGLSARIVQLANRSVSNTSDVWETPQTGEGVASPINRSGVVALTNHRLLFFAKRFAIGNVGQITAEWPLREIEAITYANKENILTINFVDGSAAGLHVPRNQSPDVLVDAWQNHNNASPS